MRWGPLVDKVGTVPVGSKVRSPGYREGLKEGVGVGRGVRGGGLTMLELDRRKNPETPEGFRMAKA